VPPPPWLAERAGGDNSARSDALGHNRPGADDGILLNLNKTTNARLIPHCTAVKVSEAEYLYGTSQGNIGSDAVTRFHAVLMMCRRRFLLLAAATRRVVPRCTKVVYFRKPKPT